MSETSIENIFAELKRLGDLFYEKISYDETKEKSLRFMNTQLEEYKEDFLFTLKKPLLFSIFNIYDEVCYFHSQSESNEETQNYMSLLQDQILEVLEEQGIEPIKHEGEDLVHFDPKYHKVVKVEETEDKEQHNTIVKIVKKGFIYQDKIIRSEQVILQRFREQQEPEQEETIEDQDN